MRKIGTVLLTGAITLMFASSAVAWGGGSMGSNSGHGNDGKSRSSMSRSAGDSGRQSKEGKMMGRWMDAGTNMKDFTDINEKSWAMPFIEHMKSRNVIGGYPDGTFKPNKPVTRAEAVKMVMFEAGVTDGDSEIPFHDADQMQEWYKSSLQAALDQEIVESTDSEDFNAQKPASRAWVALMAARMLGGEQPEQAVDASDLEYKDAAGIPEDLLWCVDYATEKGVFGGYPDGTFQPNKPVTRAEMAAIMVKLDLMQNGTEAGTLEVVNEDSITVSGSVYDLADTVYVYIDNQPADVSDLATGSAIQVDLNGDGDVVMIEATTEDSDSEEADTTADDTAESDDTSTEDTATDDSGTGDATGDGDTADNG